MPTLRYVDVDGTEHFCQLSAEPVVIGRAMECQIRSDDPRMSRQHARVVWTVDGVWIEDLGSANGVYVGSDRIRQALMPVGEIVVVGSLVFQLAADDGTVPPPMGVHATLATWLNLERKAKRVAEDERNAFAKRVADFHSQPSEADAKLRSQIAQAKGALAESEAGRRHADEALAHARRESEQARGAEAARQREHNRVVEKLTEELAKARDARTSAIASVGVIEAAARAEGQRLVATLEKQLAEEQRARAAEQANAEQANAVRDQELRAAQARAEQAERELVEARVQAQGAKRALADATDAGRTSDTNDDTRLESTGSAAPFKTMRMVLDSETEEPAAELASALAELAEQRRRAEAAETTANALSRDVTSALRAAAEHEARATELARELQASSARVTRAENQAATVARAASQEIEAARQLSSREIAVPFESTLASQEQSDFGEPDPTSLISLDDSSAAGRKELAAAELELRELEQQIGSLKAELGHVQERARTELAEARQAAEREAAEAAEALSAVHVESTTAIERAARGLVEARTQAELAIQQLQMVQHDAARSSEELAAARAAADAAEDRAAAAAADLIAAQAQLANAEARAKAAEAMVNDRADASDTAAIMQSAAPVLPPQQAWLVDTLEESIDSVRANLRAASDELLALTTGVGPADPAIASDALTSADADLRRARQAAQDLTAWLRGER